MADLGPRYLDPAVLSLAEDVFLLLSAPGSSGRRRSPASGGWTTLACEWWLDDARRSPPRRAPEMDPGLAEVARQMKREYMERWVDESVPALGGLTPREAASIKSRRNMLETLLRQMEYGEAGQPEAERTDFGALRKTLGMN
ncbi:MAG: hypothetical protein ACT4OZ_10300 [Gemmatimonadota bacterium]